MRIATRWVVAVAGFSLIVLSAFIFVYMIGWGCHEPSGASRSTLCSMEPRKYRSILVASILFLSPVMAAAFAVVAAPSHKRAIGVVAVLCPIIVEATFLWNRLTGGISPITDVIPLVVLAMPATICTVFLVWYMERRVVA